MSSTSGEDQSVFASSKYCNFCLHASFTSVQLTCEYHEYISHEYMNHK